MISKVQAVLDFISGVKKKGTRYFLGCLGLLIGVILIFVCIKYPDMFADFTFFKSYMGIIMGFVICIISLFIFPSEQKSSGLTNEDKIALSELFAKEIAKYDEMRRRMHEEASARRIKAKTAISEKIFQLLVDTHADRVDIFEMHNGKSNPSGLPFVYAEHTYEAVTKDAPRFNPLIKDFNLSSFPFICNHFEDGIWWGTVDDVHEEDPVLGDILKDMGIKYLYTIVISSVHREEHTLGFMTVTYGDNDFIPIASDDVRIEISMATQDISTLLDMEDRTIV